MYDTLLYAKQYQIPGLLLMVDFEKAFDSVAWSFIEKSLHKFKFGKDITRWILTFYTNINSCVHVNGQYSINVDKTKAVSAWSRRNLTPFGRVTVIKSLVISKITHLLMNLPDPEESFLKELNKLKLCIIFFGMIKMIK